MPVKTKEEAEALTVPELKAELEARGLATEGIKVNVAVVFTQTFRSGFNCGAALSGFRGRLVVSGCSIAPWVWKANSVRARSCVARVLSV